MTYNTHMTKNLIQEMTDLTDYNKTDGLQEITKDYYNIEANKGYINLGKILDNFYCTVLTC